MTTAMRAAPGSTGLTLTLTFALALVLTLGLGPGTASATPEDADGQSSRAEVLARHSLRGLDGTSFAVSDLRGRIVVLNFWASWCAPCREELPLFERYQDELGERGMVVAVSIDRNEENARRFVEEHALSLLVAIDRPDGLARRLDLPSIPSTLVLDHQGQPVFETSASGPEAVAEVRAAVSAIPDVER